MRTNKGSSFTLTGSVKANYQNLAAAVDQGRHLFMFLPIPVVLKKVAGCLINRVNTIALDFAATLGIPDGTHPEIKHTNPHKSVVLQKGNINMIANPAQITRHHLANQIAPAYCLIRKVCACGKASTAKLQHMLGAVAQYPKSKWGWRNYFAAGSGQQHEAMQRLVAAGLATAGRAANEMTYFHATRLGCKAVGLDAAGIKRAMEG
ncbi:MAG: hypothetical protein ACOH2S_12130 [Janthinobacterium svalbardensis]